MKKFAFSLEKVLNYKNQTGDALKNELAFLQHQLKEIEDEIETLEEMFEKKNQVLREQMLVGVSSGDISVYKIYLNDLTATSRRKQFEKNLKLDEIHNKQQEIINMNIEIASLEKLKENQVEEYRKAAAKAQELELNEFIGNKMHS